MIIQSVFDPVCHNDKLSIGFCLQEMIIDETSCQFLKHL